MNILRSQLEGVIKIRMLLRTVNRICFPHINMNSLNSTNFVNRMSILTYCLIYLHVSQHTTARLLFRKPSDMTVFNIS